MTSIPTEQLDRALVGAAVALVFTPADEDGIAITFAVNTTVTMAVVDGAGTAVTGSPFAATLAVDRKSASVTIPTASLAHLDTYDATWAFTSGATVRSWQTTLQVCGGYHCTVDAFRNLRSEFATVAASDIRDARTLAEVRFEDACKVAFVPRGARASLKGDGTDVLLLGHVELREIYSLSIDGTDLTVDELAALDLSGKHAGIVVNVEGTWTKDSAIETHYAHGYDRADRPVRGAIMTLMKDYIVPDSTLPPRAVLQLSDFGNFRMAQPDENHPFGDMPEVESVYELYNRRRPAVG